MDSGKGIGVDGWLATIRQEGARMAAAPVESLTLDVPTCPGWTVADLIGHTGAVHRWATDRVTRRDQYRGYAEIDVPQTSEVLEWYAEGRDLLLEALASSSPDTPAPTFVGERDVAWWCRRQANEVAVHRWDLDSAVRPGHERPVDAVLALDGIDEWRELFVSRFLTAGPGVPEALIGATLGVCPIDIDGVGRRFTVSSSGFAVDDDVDAADAVISGSASDLLLTIWHRRPLSSVEVGGRAGAAAAVLDLVHVT
ncbi:MAG: maleylpyruvate isomerase family mycothiol-dependent enzyme [Gordonia sp. (in: high G+C Gram-positive bacteria)]